MPKQAIGYPTDRSLLNKEMGKIVDGRRQNLRKFEELLKAALSTKKKARPLAAR